jgi:hypothetical protein
VRWKEGREGGKEKIPSQAIPNTPAAFPVLLPNAQHLVDGQWWAGKNDGKMTGKMTGENSCLIIPYYIW